MLLLAGWPTAVKVGVGLLVVAVGFVFRLLRQVLRKRYSVHQAGAVLITGCSSGIGRDAAIAVAKIGRYQVFAAVRSAKDQAELEGLGIAALKPIILDVTKAEDISRAVDTVKASQLPFIGLVNNAGVSVRAPVEVANAEETRKVYDVNVFGLLEVTKAFLPLLRQAQGRIVNVGSIAGAVAMAGASTYSGTKFAVRAITDSLRREMMPFGVSVSLIAPGAVATKIITKRAGEAAESAEMHCSEELRKVYADYYAAADNMRRQMFSTAAPTSVTSDAIVHALTSFYPKTRYVVGNAGRLSIHVLDWLVWLLPDRLLDVMTANTRRIVGGKDKKGD